MVHDAFGDGGALFGHFQSNMYSTWTTRADFEIGGRRYGVFAHDWRVEPAEQWLRLKAERASRIDRTVGA
jgi:hypothetical protein